jgi:hypothetical protein
MNYYPPIATIYPKTANQLTSGCSAQRAKNGDTRAVLTFEQCGVVGDEDCIFQDCIGLS